MAINATYAAIGVSHGALIPNLTGAVAVALVWIAPVESTVANLLGDVGRRLPNRAGLAVDDMPANTALLMPQGGATLVLAGYAAVFILAALTISTRRDVT